MLISKEKPICQITLKYLYLFQQIAGRRMTIYGARHNPRLRRPIRPYLRPRKKPKVVFGVLQNVPSPPRRADVVYPYGIGGK